MKRLNNKGITTIEVLLCFVLVVIITVSMYSTITSFNQKRLMEQYKEKIYTYKELLTKDIQDDLIQIGLTHAKYNRIIVSSSNTSSYPGVPIGAVVHTVDCDLKDGTTRQLRVYQAFTRAKTRISTNTAANDYFMIEYGPTGSLIQYPIPDLGESPAFPDDSSNTSKIKDLTINNIMIKIIDDQVLSIYIGLYHPELTTRFGIDIVSPIDYIAGGASGANTLFGP